MLDVVCVCARACGMVCEGGSGDNMDSRIDILGRKDGLMCRILLEHEVRNEEKW